MIRRSTVLCLGLSQLVCWGVTYYLIGGFGERMVSDLGWSRERVYGGFSLALLVMGLVSPLAGRLIDRHGGARVMAAGSLLAALGCAGLAAAHTQVAWYAAWLCLGVAMRLCLYDAAFAALARIGGPQAQRAMAGITLLGGLASTVFWPLGNALATRLGWRGAVWVYAGIALATLPLHLAIPRGRHVERPRAARAQPAPLAATPGDRRLAGALYALIVTVTGFLNSGMSAHMIDILGGLGLAAGSAVWVASLRGIGQSGARLAEVLSGGRLAALDLNVLATAVLPPCFLAGLAGGAFAPAAVAFSFFYGAGNGIVTITRGTVPLVLFEPRDYGTLVGRLLVPGFLCAAAAPLAYAFIIERGGAGAALLVSAAAAAVTLTASLVLRRRFGRRAAPG